jgi:lipopolysaccharide assembly outer membrane protein LptD (OstA)
MRTLMLTLALALQGTGQVEFGRVGPGSVSGSEGRPVQIGRSGTSYVGKADRVQQQGKLTTWRGNVTVTFRESQMVLHAQEMTLDAGANELILRGDVRLKLDTQ